MPEAKTFREWRKEKGYTTKYIAEKLGISPKTLTAKERDQFSFTILQKTILCEIYGIKAEDVR